VRHGPFQGAWGEDLGQLADQKQGLGDGPVPGRTQALAVAFGIITRFIPKNADDGSCSWLMVHTCALGLASCAFLGSAVTNARSRRQVGYIFNGICMVEHVIRQGRSELA
jgi:hypothetical protein